MNQNSDEENLKKVDLKKGFFKKVKLSIFNVEKYPEMAVEGVPRAIAYLAKLVAILAVIVCICLVVKTNQVVNQTVDYIENNFPDFSYQDGVLDVKSDDVLTYENDYFGKIVVDTKSEEKEVDENFNGFVILKDKIIVKNAAVVGTATYKYSEVLNQMGFTKFDKQSLVQYAKGTQMTSLYVSVFATVFIYAFIMYFLNTFVYVLMCSVFGYFASLFTKIKMRYAGIFNMSVYAITLSTLLNAVYIAVRLFVDFDIKYFEIMYVSVATIYLFAAIFIIKDDLIKNQAELTKIIEVQKQVRKELDENQEDQDSRKQDKEKNGGESEGSDVKDKGKADGKNNEKDNGVEQGEAPEGTNA